MNARNGKDGGLSHLGTVIRREMRSSVNKSYLNGLPLFRADHTLPRQLADLLSQLDQAEARASKS